MDASPLLEYLGHHPLALAVVGVGGLAMVLVPLGLWLEGAIRARRRRQ